MLSVLVISARVGKTPEEVSFSFVFDEIYRLAKKDIKVHVVRSVVERDDISHGIYFYGLNRILDPEVFNLMMRNVTKYSVIPFLRRNPFKLYWENLYALNAIRIAKRNSIDIIHSHFAYPEGFVGALVKDAIRKPLVITCHGYDINTVPEIGYGIRLRKEYDTLVRIALRSADAVISVSTRMKKKIIELGIDPNKVYIIPNGVDLKLFRPPSKQDIEDIIKVRKLFGINDDEFLIVKTRHLHPVYGLHYLIYAMKMVTQRVKNVKLIITGEGPLRDTLLELARKLEVDKYVRFVGTVPRILMPKLMQASSIYVNTSLSEGCPVSLIEAAASGVPIVSFDVGGVSDIVVDGFNGFLCPPRNPKAIADRILYLLENPSEIKRMGLNGRRLAEEKFDMEKKVTEIIKLYKKLI